MEALEECTDALHYLEARRIKDEQERADGKQPRTIPSQLSLKFGGG